MDVAQREESRDGAHERSHAQRDSDGRNLEF
jgi:hypothetical protein